MNNFEQDDFWFGLFTKYYRVIKSMGMGWVGQVARMGDEKPMQNFSRETRKEETGYGWKLI
jgi:hypothetical protein